METDPAPRTDSTYRGEGLLWGFALVGLGAWWLLHEVTGIPFSWGWMGPVALVVVGLTMVFGRRRC